MYLDNENLQEANQRFLSTLKDGESIGRDAVIIYAKGQYAIFDLDEYTLITMDLSDEAKQRLGKLMKKSIEEKKLIAESEAD